VNLSGNNISKLPDEIRELHNLTSLKLNNNVLVDLPAGIGSLVNLTSLDLSKNKISNLPPEIGELSALQRINLEQNPLTELPSSIENLSRLSSLNLFSCRLNNVPPEIGKLTNLYSLNLYNNELQSLPPEIGNLEKLSWLDISSNKLSQLPLEFSNLKNLSTLYIEKNPLIYPVEILDTFAPQELVNYIQRIRDTNPKPINEAKIIFVGEASVGKTSLTKRVIYDEFSVKQEKTDGIFISRWQVKSLQKVDNEKVKIDINAWDFGGQEIMHSTHQFFLTKRSLYLLVIDSRNSQEQNQVEYWLKIIQSFGGESPVLIVGNKIDQHPLDIDRTGLQKKYPNIVGILETSAATGTGIEALKTAITDQVNNLPHVLDLLPETWFTVKTKLEGLGRESNFITHDKYLDLCAENEVSDETSQRTLIGFLHDLGVVLHFQDDPRLEALGILNPQWVTNGVYKILNSHTLFQNKGVFTTSMLDEILNLPEYPRGKRLFIVDMMKKFELCYDIESDKTFLVPDLLPKDQPDLNFNGVPAFEYAYPVLPSSVITRFIVRMNQKIDDGFVWRTGVVLKIGENKALVKADIEDRKITIAIEGVEHTRRDTLSAIRYQLDEIHNSIKGLNPEKYVPISGAVSAKPLKYEYLLKLERDGEETIKVEDGNGLKKVNIAQILNGVESEYQRKQYGNVINIGGNVTDSTIIAGDENEVKK